MNKQIKEVFENFSSADFQKNSWFGLSDEISSPSELCNSLDDYNVEIWLENNKENLDSFSYRYIKEFLNFIDSMEDDCEDPWRSFYSIEWIQLRLMASVIVNYLNKI